MTHLADLWRRLQAVAAQTPKSLCLRPPASESAIAAAERTIGLAFPADFRASLLVHDGQDLDDDGEDAAFEWLPGQPRLASLERIVEEWQRHCETHAFHYPDNELEEIEGGALNHVFWHPRRIPIAGNSWWDQDNLYLDLIPGPVGIPGQLAAFGKGAFGEVIGPSFGVTLELYVEALESGRWLYRDGQCVPRTKRLSWPRYVAKRVAQRAALDG